MGLADTGGDESGQAVEKGPLRVKVLLEGGAARPEVTPMSVTAHGPPGASGPVAGEAGALAWRWSRAAMDWGTRRPGRRTVSVPLVCVCVCGCVCVCVCPRGVSGGGGAWRVLVSAAWVVAAAPSWERLALGVGVRGTALLLAPSQHRSAPSRKPFVWGGGA